MAPEDRLNMDIAKQIPQLNRNQRIDAILEERLCRVGVLPGDDRHIR